MSERVERLPSKIVQYDDYNNVALCENGSVWEYFHMSKLWAQIHPPHEPPKQADDLSEALKVLRRLWTYTEPISEKSEEAYEDAHDFLKKHGA
jgi:hypothetical protein